MPSSTRSPNGRTDPSKPLRGSAPKPLVFLDAIRVKVRDEGTVRNKAVYVALGVRPDGTKEVLGLWIEQTEGAKFWLRVMNELKDRGMQDILIAVVDGLKGFPEAIAAVFPKTQVQACIVHLIRRSLDFVSYKDRREVAAALKEIYRARTAEAGEAALEAFDEGPWGRKYPVIAQTWRRHWAEVVPFYSFPAEVRRIVYTTDEIDKTFVRPIEYPFLPRATARQRAGLGGESPAAQPYRRASFAAPVRPDFGPAGCQLLTACSYARSAC
jgi:transposase-like protein